MSQCCILYIIFIIFIPDTTKDLNLDAPADETNADYNDYFNFNQGNYFRANLTNLDVKSQTVGESTKIADLLTN